MRVEFYNQHKFKLSLQKKIFQRLIFMISIKNKKISSVKMSVLLSILKRFHIKFFVTNKISDNSNYQDTGIELNSLFGRSIFKIKKFSFSFKHKIERFKFLPKLSIDPKRSLIKYKINKTIHPILNYQ